MRITHNTTVRGLQVINHILLFAGLVYVVTNQAYFLLFLSVVTFWIWGTLGLNVYLHRLISHRSFKTTFFFEKTFGLISVLTTVGSPLAWATVHRQHHRVSDKEDDPHSPFKLGILKAWFGLWNLKHLDFKLAKDLKRDKFIRWLHNNYLKIIIFYVIILFLMDPWFVIFFYAIPACLCLHSTSAIVVIAHMHGYVTHPLKIDKSKNSWIANLITLGEGWHNNHHAKPYHWTTKEKWWEFDLPGLIIKYIRVDR